MSAKYPRTPHLPFSPGGTNDDRRLVSSAHFVEKRVVILEKMDGANWCEERTACYSRSHSGRTKNPIFDRAKAEWATRRWSIDPGVSVFGEWLYCRHNISYISLPAFFILFGARWNENGEWYAWDEVELTALELGAPTVPKLWEGVIKSEQQLQGLVETFCAEPSACGGEREGVVVRVTGRIQVGEWEHSIAKWVRLDHVQSTPSARIWNRLA